MDRRDGVVGTGGQMTELAIIGAGNWGHNWVKTLATLPEVNLRWVCDLNPNLLARVRQQFPAIRTTPCFEDLLDDPDIEGVIIATMAGTHYALAEKILKAGHHVLVEKPMTLKVEEAERLHHLAREQKRILMVGHLLEYHPAVLLIKQMIETDELGQIHYLYSQRLNYGTVRRRENAWWSLAPHDISVACRLLGSSPISVHCRGQNIIQPDIADVVFATLEFPGGKLAHIHVSWLDPQKTRKLTVVGSKKMVVFDDSQTHYKVTVHEKSYHLTPHDIPNTDWITLREGDILCPKLEMTDPLVREARHFVQCIQKNHPPLSDGAAGLTNVRVLESGQRSLETNQLIPIPTTFEPFYEKISA